MNRRMMMSSRKFAVEYSLGSLTAHNYIQINGEGEKYCGNGEIEVKSGDYLLCYAYANSESSIEKDGVIVAKDQNNSITYKFYPRADSKIEAKKGLDVIGTHIVITTL